MSTANKSSSQNQPSTTTLPKTNTENNSNNNNNNNNGGNNNNNNNNNNNSNNNNNNNNNATVENNNNANKTSNVNSNTSSNSNSNSNSNLKNDTSTNNTDTNDNNNKTKTPTQQSSTVTAPVTSSLSSSLQQNAQNNNATSQTLKQETKNTTNNNELIADFDDNNVAESKTNLIINFIPPTMNEGQLATLFSPYGTMENCKIVYDLKTGRSRGYGFVQYKNEESALRACQALNGFMAQGKRLKVGFARPNSKEIQNGNLYVTNLPLDFTDGELRKIFQDFGGIIECRILHNSEGQSRGIGFVRFDTHLNAVNALQARDNQVVRPDAPPITVKLAQRLVPKRILMLQKQLQQRDARNKNVNFKANYTGGIGGNVDHQSPNRRYVRQQSNDNQQPNDNNYNQNNPYNYNNNNNNNNNRRQSNYRSRNNNNNQMFNQNNRQRYSNDYYAQNAPMYNNVSDFPQYPSMMPPYYDPNVPFNSTTNQFAAMNISGGINNVNPNQQAPINMQQPLTTNILPNAPVLPNVSNNNNSANIANRGQVPASTFNVIVNNLPPYYNVDHLIQLYAPYGPIQSVNIQKPSKQSTTGIISYFYFDDAQRAQNQTNGRRLENNQRLEVFFNHTK